jgi:hypothetical protein
VTDIFQEVDQSLREDRFAVWWKKYSLFVYAVIAIAIIGVSILEVLRWMRSEEINKEARIYDAAFAAREANDLATARADFAQLADARTGFGVLSGHMLAGVEKELTNDVAAVEAHLAAAAKADNGVMGELALLKLAYSKADTAPLAELEATLKPLLDKDGQATSLARELIASKALSEGNTERARDLFELLATDIQAPGGMQQRVQQALATLPPRIVNLDGPVKPAPAPTVPATPAPAAPAPAKPAQAPQ